MQTLDTDIPLQAWTQSTSWRPLLALACQAGFIQVPDMPNVYRRRAGEAIADNLCGLWAVGPSTLYRYVEKGRRLLSDVMAQPPGGKHALSLREAVCGALPLAHSDSLEDWHLRQAQDAIRRDSAALALWHHWKAGDTAACATTLSRYALDLASKPEVDLVLSDLKQRDLTPVTQFELLVGESALWRFRQDEARELQSLQLALRLGQETNNPLLLGRAYSALALYDESREPERAISRFHTSMEHLLRAANDNSDLAVHRRALGEYAYSTIYLAWLHLRRNDPLAKPLLASVRRMQEDGNLPDAANAFFELALGEQCRCEGDLPTAIEHQLRSLSIYERLGDRRAVVTGFSNLCLLYGQLGDFGKAQMHGNRVLNMAQEFAVEPKMLANAHGNLAVAHLNAGELEMAITQLHHALTIHGALGMKRHVVAVNLNLAEAHYKLYKRDGDVSQEHLGDAHAQLAREQAQALELSSFVRTAEGLKNEILKSMREAEQLQPPEHAAHPHESAELDRLRSDLAIPRPAAQRARTHLAIARQYLLIAAKEREAARALIAKHNVADDFSAEFDALRQAWERELTREQQLAALWREKLGDLMSDAQRRAVVAHVLAEGAISKSGYASVAQVSPATASKHLGLLAERGLLLQLGNGPSTRYVLPTMGDDKAQPLG